MSLILEALKKAERQHRMGEVPGIGVAHHVDLQKRSKLFAILLVGMVAVGMLILGIYLGEDAPVQQVNKLEEPTIDLPFPVSMQPAVQLEQVEQPVQDSRPAVLKKEIMPLQGEEPRPKPKQKRIEPAVELPVSKIAKIPDKPKSKKPPAKAKSISQLPDGFVEKLPLLNIDIHSYDKQQGRSYVLINMEKYREGDTLAEGPLLIEILPDGVVLEHMNERFILPIGNY
ncbi:MAG: general secretion pathway protein GspB [Pseudomonadota bacterium]